MGEIRKKLDAIQVDLNALQTQIQALQAECEHPAYERGLSMKACVHEVLFCTECGHMRPLNSGQNESDGQKWLI